MLSSAVYLPARPSDNGTSGPTTTRIGLMDLQRATMSGTLVAGADSTGQPLMVPMVPALPGATTIRSTSGDVEQAHTIACSRPPEPTTTKVPRGEDEDALAMFSARRSSVDILEAYDADQTARARFAAQVNRITRDSQVTQILDRGNASEFPHMLLQRCCDDHSSGEILCVATRSRNRCVLVRRLQQLEPSDPQVQYRTFEQHAHR
jgi:hypothetical protein